MGIFRTSILVIIILSCCASFPGKNLIVSIGPNFSEIKTVEKILLEFKKKFNLPGVSIAISHNNKLVYSAACGYADSENKVKLTPMYRMRIASVSKPITSIAIMRLYEDGKLKLSDRVFGKSSILGLGYGLPVFNGKPAIITVENLLSHTSGGWGVINNDTMVSFPDLNGKDLIQTVLKYHPLKNKPGIKYEYSNFGYYILGRIIEKISGQSYENYVKETILAPLKIKGMRIGFKSKTEDEVVYYPSGSEDPYSVNPQHFDSHGGWIANPVELLKVLSGISMFEEDSGILKDDTIKLMTTIKSLENNYALGFYINQNNIWWHSGSLPGTSSQIGRTSDGFCWAILINYRPQITIIDNQINTDKNFYEDLSQLFGKIKNSVKFWPDGDHL